MRGGALPPALLCAAVGFALAFAPRRIVALCILILIAATFGSSLTAIPPAWVDRVFAGCWISMILTAGSVHLPKGIGPRLAAGLSFNGGVWAGGVIAAAGAPLDIAKSLPWALLCIPGGWIVARGQSIIIKVMASWLIAVGMLALSLQWAPTTPGYKPDHMD